MRPSPITPTIDLDAPGLRHGFLRLPHSRDDAAWGNVMIPVTVARGGDGPLALLTGGNHGDEYEGPTALWDLAHSLRAEDLSGGVIIIPAMNYPAFLAGTRTSPIDRGNMNRIFPGKPDGTVTEKIADYFQRHLLPRADVVLDFHSGGKTLDFLPFCAAHDLPDAALTARAMALVSAFGAPWSMRMTEIDAVGMYDTAAEEMGKVFVTTELGGGGSASARTIGIAKRGLRNLLRAAGVMKGAPEPSVTQWLDMPEGCFAFAEDGGLYEPLIDLGEAAQAGAPVGRIWPTGRTGTAPVIVAAPISGILAARHFPGLIKPGDCAAVMGRPA